MSSTITQSILGRIGRRIAAIVADCNYAETRLAGLQHTPERF
ncbi:MAG TPA: hypothetical protein VN969_17460 [Streptosporangiaceae bacterium]|jgi:hypothetical protein|nr:hypothetical protein [Streptosporangiaceae bacterium]